MSIGTTYHTALLQILERIRSEQWTALNAVADRMAATMFEGGLVHLFGSGHSHLAPEEAFFRSGGLAPMNPILDPGLMLHEGIAKVVRLERLEGYADVVLDRHDLREGEVMIVFSASGKNPVPVDVALRSGERGLFTVAVTSLDYALRTPAMHSSGKHLHEVVDAVIDSGAPYGDALVEDERLGGLGAVGAVSTVTSLYVVNILQGLVVDRYLDAGRQPPLTVCFNTGEEAAADQNEFTFRDLRARMRHL
jgi:uncharacterized phosphosugar-binding protein